MDRRLLAKKISEAGSKAAHRDPPQVIPTDLALRQFACANCGLHQPVDWLHKQPHPKQSIAGNSGTGHWVPVSFLNNCARCLHLNDIEVERAELRGSLQISADEAIREVEGVTMFLLAGCGISPEKRERIGKEIDLLERQLARESAGRITSFHAKDIMNSKAWPGVKKATRVKFIKKMCRVARSIRVSKFATAGAISSLGANEKRNLRDLVFSAYTMRTLDRCTRAGVSPVFAFDQTQAGKKNGWAEECMIGLRRYPLFVWFSRSAHVPDIVHVVPGSTPESKLADCLAFVIGREFHHRMLGKASDVDTRWLGHANFSGFDGYGNLLFSDGVGFPYKRIFGLSGVR